MSRTLLDNVPLLFAVVAEFLSTIACDMPKLLATIVLRLSFPSIPPLCNINQINQSSSFFRPTYNSLGSHPLFLT
ncbi:hypothetical protein Sjap_015402 [Stephania japonica]|uniref:Secreted protein n=1 Tax=Stephania japonica TaxID=461633 RepID=A0AAP0NSU1_9MAGN